MESLFQKSVLKALGALVLLLFYVQTSSALPINSLLVETDLYSDTVSEDIAGNEINFQDRYEADSFYVTSPVNIFTWEESISQDLTDEYWESLVAELGVTFSMDASVTETYTVSLSLDYAATDINGAEVFYFESEIDGLVEDLTQNQFSQVYSFDITGGESVAFDWFYELLGSGDNFSLASSTTLSLTSVELADAVSVDEPSTLLLLLSALIGLVGFNRKSN